MIGLHNLSPAKGSKHRKKIVGRGVGSGHGRTATRGSKGQKSRSGDGSKKMGFEGGQMPIFRRIPKRGFNSRSRKKYEIVNVGDLDRFEIGSEVTPLTLRRMRLTSKMGFVKILGFGEIKKSLTVSVHAFSKSAHDKVQAAGGIVKIVGKYFGDGMREK
jgi:large subunit ribosomal protein L15